MEEKVLSAASAATKVAVERIGSVSALADLVGVTRVSVHRWIAGTSLISVENAVVVARESGLRLSDFRPDIELEGGSA